MYYTFIDETKSKHKKRLAERTMLWEYWMYIISVASTRCYGYFETQ